MKTLKALVWAITLLLAATSYGQSTEEVTAIQYFYNVDPGIGMEGNGEILEVTPSANYNETVALQVPGDLSPGIHHLYVRARDENNRWSISERRSIYVSSLVNGASDITAYQYFIDAFEGNNDPEYSGLVSISQTDAFSSTVAISIPTDISPGIHHLYIRVKDTSGRWSLAERRMFYTSKVADGSANIVAYQYYLDAFPGTTIPDYSEVIDITSTAELNSIVTIPIPEDLTPGLHHLYLRVKDEFGQWSLAERRMFYTSERTDTPADIIAYQYYFNTDPGLGNTGNGAVIEIPSTTSLNTTIAINVPNDLPHGIHHLYIRTKDQLGQWSLAERRMLYVDDHVASPKEITALEYFFDTDLGVGTGNPIPVDLTTDYNEVTDLGVPCLSSGIHYLYLRAKDITGQWSIIQRDTIEVTEGITPAIVEPTGPISICSGDEIILSASPAPGVTYQWTKDNVDLDGETNPTLSVTTSGDYNLRSYCGETFTPSNTVSVTVQTLNTYFADSDNDGFGDALSTVMDCSPPAGYVTNNLDCNDTDELIYPGAEETCNGYDDNCNGEVDEGVQTIFYADADGDGYGDPDVTESACTVPSGFVANALDCNDTDAAIHPDAEEVCNGIDDNCNGEIDEGVQTLYYADVDGDGYGDLANTILACSLPEGYSTTGDDCNDNDAAIHPGALEVCNGIDDNCDGLTDDDDPSITGQDTWYEDFDGDGYGNAGIFVLSCQSPAGYVSNPDDCNDSDPTIHPNADELCNEIDDNCNTMIDEGVLEIFFADADGDSFGDPGVSVEACTLPDGYVTNNLDCNDDDADEYPGQIWYLDLDDDGYSAGITIEQCARPDHGYLPSELLSLNDDCDDSNPNINPGAQYFTYSTAPNYGNTVISPLSGSAYTSFSFEVVYYDATNSLPTVTFPRVMLDYEGNGNFTNPNDRTIIMSEVDASDVSTIDGKKYFGQIDALPIGTTWQTSIQAQQGSCLTSFGPFNYPDVFVLPDLQIFADDIVFNPEHPSLSSPMTVSATVHNVSDFNAQNFEVRLENQFNNTVYPHVLVNQLGPHESTVVSWNITSPSVPAWCPMKVSVDYTNAIDETNELDNYAIRPFINGNYNLPGGILVNATTNPSSSHSGAVDRITLSGYAEYFDTAIPLDDPGVAGGEVTFTIQETNATYTTNTNSAGYFSFSFPAPLIDQEYHLQVVVTDYTLTGDTNIVFEILPALPCLPDYVTDVQLSTSTVVAGNALSGSITVRNNGCDETTNSSLLDVTQSGGVPDISDATVPPLSYGESFTSTFSNVLFDTPGVYTICGAADANFEIAETNEANNSTCKVIVVLPALPDIAPLYQDTMFIPACSNPDDVTFFVKNNGGVSTGAFSCLITAYYEGVFMETISHDIDNIDALSSTEFSIPFTFSNTGKYSFQIACDLPLPDGIVVETNETNNVTTNYIYITNCLPNLILLGCESFDVEPVDPENPGTVDYVATIMNTGNATAVGPIDISFSVSDGTVLNTQFPNDLLPGESGIVSVSASSVIPATESLTAEVDPLNTIIEFRDDDNLIGGELCWDFQPVPKCVLTDNFWYQSYLVNQAVYLSIGLDAYHLYDASAVKVRFEVSGPGISGTLNLGNAIVENVEQTCNCPRVAALPYSYVFPEEGVFTITMTVDPDNQYTECDEENNVLIKNISVTNLPDMRVLSQYIQPTYLNPDVGESISLDITYENIGLSNIDDLMTMDILVDEVPFASISGLGGLVTGDNTTVPVPGTWSSTTPGVHVIRAIIDANDDITETNESNNEATRAVIVGQSANLYFQSFVASDPNPLMNEMITLDTWIGNNGDLDCSAQVRFYYLPDVSQGSGPDTTLIGILPLEVSANDSFYIQLPWRVADATTTLIAEIVNSSVLEFTYDDNLATTQIGGMLITLTETQDCANEEIGTLTPIIEGGELPYTYTWSTGYNGPTLTAGAGSYTLTISDNTALTSIVTGSISNQEGVVYYADTDLDGYGDPQTQTISCNGIPEGYVDNFADCNDADSTIHPLATEICDYLDNDCNGFTDDADPAIVGQVSWYFDNDQDGAGDPQTMILACNQPSGYVATGDDCDDNNASVYPDAPEILDGLDNDCDGAIDENFSDIAVDAGSCLVVYYGFEQSECTTLQVEVQGGTAPYTYWWSTNETTPEINVCPEVTTLFEVVVTDQNGFSAADVVTVQVVDVRCGNNNNKISVCHIPPGNPENQHTICISPNAVESHLAEHGDYLGPCDMENPCGTEDPPTRSISGVSETKESPSPNEVLAIAEDADTYDKLSVYPSPTNEYFILDLKSKEDSFRGMVYDAKGNVMTSFEARAGKHLIRTANWTNGIYYIRIQTASKQLLSKVVIMH